MEPQIKYALTDDGVSIGYWTIGEGNPLIWPHGAVGATSLRAWRTPEGRALIERIAAHRMLVRYDARGFGISQEGTVDLSLEARVRDLDAVINRLGAERVDLCGYLDSGPAALAYAATHPERIAHLLLWSTTSRGVTFVEDELERVLNDLSRVDFEIWREAYVATVMRSLVVDAGAHELARMLAGMLTPETGPQFVESVRIDVTDVLANIQAPTLILHRRGIKRPRMTDIQAMAARIPNVRLALLEGDASLPYIGNTEAVLIELEEFLDAGANTPAQPARPAPGGVATVLFTDLVGHTQMMHRLGDAKGRDVLREHERITRETLNQHGGAEVKTMGDGFMASFGSVTKAMDCAIALQRAFAARDGEPLQVRVGLNAGEPIEEEGDLFGSTVILASRIAAKAGAGEILVPGTVRGLLSGKRFVFGDRGEFVPKGFDEGVRLWDVRWRHDA